MPRKGTRCPKCRCAIYGGVHVLNLNDDATRAKLQCKYCATEWVTRSIGALQYIRKQLKMED